MRSKLEEVGERRESTKDEPDGFPTCKNMLYLPGRVWKPSSVPVVCLLLRVWVMFGANRSVPAPPPTLTSIWWLAYCLEARRDDPVLQRKLARKFNSIKRNARSGYGFLFWVKAEKGVRNSNPEGQDRLQDLLNHIWNMFPVLLSPPPCSYNWPTGITQFALILFHMWLFLIRRLDLIFFPLPCHLSWFRWVIPFLNTGILFTLLAGLKKKKKMCTQTFS